MSLRDSSPSSFFPWSESHSKIMKGLRMSLFGSFRKKFLPHQRTQKDYREKTVFCGEIRT